MIVVATLAAILLLLTIAAIALARRIILDRPRPTMSVLCDGTVVTVPRTSATQAPGRYALTHKSGATHVVGEIVAIQRNTVTRRVVSSRGTFPKAKTRASWTGQIISGPGSLGEHTDVSFRTPHGIAQGWLLGAPSGRTAGTWAIHIHGIRSSRAGALRSVPATQQVDATSLVLSFAGFDKPEGRRPAATLGQNESDDVLAAVKFALESGATDVVLVGWSMGATAALLAAEREPDPIAGLILIDPATNWPAILRAAARRSKLPAFAGDLAGLALRFRVSSRLAGSPHPVRVDQLDWTGSRRVSIPTLTIHSSGDQDIPLEISRKFERAQAPLVSLVELEAAPHCAEYNVNPARFEAAITTWWQRFVA